MPSRLAHLVAQTKRLLAEDFGTAFGGAGERSASAPMTASNPSEAERGFDDFMGSLVNSLNVRHDLDRDLAVGLVVAVAKDYATRGMLPRFPTYNATDEELGQWTAAAATSDFRNAVLQSAKSLNDEEAEARSLGR